MRIFWLIFDAFERYLIIFCLAAIVLLIFFGVLSRFVFNFAISWSEEFVRYLFIWGGLFGAAAGFRYGRHSGLSILTDRLPLPLQRVAAWVSMLVTAGFCGFMALQSFRGTMRAFDTGQTSPRTGLPVYVVNLVMALAFVWCTVRAAQFFFAPPQGKSELQEELETIEKKNAPAASFTAGRED